MGDKAGGAGGGFPGPQSGHSWGGGAGEGGFHYRRGSHRLVPRTFSLRPATSLAIEQVICLC